MNNPHVFTGVDTKTPFDMTIIAPKLAGLPDGYHTPETIRRYITNPNVYGTTRHYESLKYNNDGNNDGNTKTSPPRLQNRS